MTGGIAGLLGGVYGQVTPESTGLLIGSVTALTPPAATVLLDGSDTVVTAITTKVATAIGVGDRVLCARLGQSVYVLTNVTGKSGGYQLVNPLAATATLSSYPSGWSYMFPPLGDTTWTTPATGPGSAPGYGVVETVFYSNTFGYQTYHDFGTTLGYGNIYTRAGNSAGWGAWNTIHTGGDDSDWVAPSLAAGFTAKQSLGYRKVNGYTEMRGAVAWTGSAGPTTAFTLPSGFLPSDVRGFPATANTTTSLFVQVLAAGQVQIYASAVTGAFIPLNQVRFQAVA